MRGAHLPGALTMALSPTASADEMKEVAYFKTALRKLGLSGS